MTLDQALRLHALGLNLIPLKPHDKVPDGEWKSFQRQRATEEDLQTWFGNGASRNAGIPTGAVSGVAVVDSDTPEAEQWCASNLPATPMMTRTAKGFHRYYRLPDALRDDASCLPGFITADNGLKIELKSDGQYVVAPGSVHPSGHVYAMVEEWPLSLEDIPTLPLHVLGGLPTGAPKADPLPESIPDGRRNTTLFTEGCRLRRLAWNEPEIAAALLTINQTRCQPPGDEHKVREIARRCAQYDPAVDTFPYTEVGDAEFFAKLHCDLVRFDHRQGRWLLASDTGLWLPDPIELLRGFAVETIRARHRHAITITDKDQKKAAVRWALGGESSKRLDHLLREARALSPIADDGSNWDMEPWLLGVENGVIDLQSGAVRLASPADRITMRARVVYDPQASCPLWEKTVSEIFDGDSELSAYIRCALGYSLSGDCREECLFMCWGDGANGKGTLMNTIGWLLHDYANDLPFSALELHDRSVIPNDIAKLVGRRFVTASESSEVRLNEARVKALTGRDPITARFLHREFFTFQPVAKFWLATNRKPIVRDDSQGFWRRIHLIPFTQTFVGREDKDLKNKLRAEAAGILAWLVRGCLEWQREGLNPPRAVRAATEEYRRESDPLTPFFEARCVLAVDARVKASELYAAYQNWCDECHVKDWQRFNQTTFGKQVKKRFATEEKRHTFYLGIGLLDASQREMF